MPSSLQRATVSATSGEATYTVAPMAASMPPAASGGAQTKPTRSPGKRLFEVPVSQYESGSSAASRGASGNRKP